MAILTKLFILNVILLIRNCWNDNKFGLKKYVFLDKYFLNLSNWLLRFIEIGTFNKLTHITGYKTADSGGIRTHASWETGA